MKLSLRLTTVAGLGLAIIGRSVGAEPAIRTIDCRVGDIVQLSAFADADPTLAFQWRRNGLDLAGETRASLDVAIQHLSDSDSYTVLARTLAGGRESETMILRVKPLAPTPATAMLQLGGSVAFGFADRTFGADTRFQWLRDGISIVGATGTTLELTALTASNAGTYSVLITSPAVELVTSAATLSFAANKEEAPAVQTQPRNVILRRNNSDNYSRQPLALSVFTAEENGPVTYRWQYNGDDISAEDSPTLVVLNPRPGDYSVTVSNSFGSSTIRAATVSLNSTRSRLRNIASVLSLGRASTSQTIGFYVIGNRAKRMLTRAVGPTLRSFGVSGAAEDPFLEIFDASAKLVAANDNWMGDTAQASMMRELAAGAGAFPLIEASADAALVATIGPGGYNLKTTVNSGSGELVLAEVYDLDAADDNMARISNFSRRDRIEIAPHALISSLVVEGGSAMTLIFRAVGPTLRSLGVPNAVSRTEITVTDTSGKLRARNAAWETAGNSPALIALSKRIGAFGLQRGSGDAALISTLEPGSYTIQVATRDANPGEVLLEVYEIE
jgi:hypothetical protein